MSETMLKSLVERINSGDINSVTEKEVFLGIFYELQGLNNKLDNLEDKFETSVKSVALRTEDLRKTIEYQEKKIKDLEDFEIEYRAYIRLIPGISLVISLLTGIMVIWQKLKS